MKKELITTLAILGPLFAMDKDVKWGEKKISYKEIKENKWNIDCGQDDNCYVVYDMKTGKNLYFIVKALAYGGEILAENIDDINADGDCWNIQSNGKTYHADILVCKKIK